MSIHTEILDILQSGAPFVVASHRRPDGDALGSMLALSLWLRRRGSEAWAVCPGGPPDTFRFLPGVDLLEASAPGELESYVLIVVDTPELSRADGGDDLKRNSRSVINIDHHPDNSSFGDVNLIDPTASSAALLVEEVLRGGGALTRDEATALYTGVMADTGGFRFGNTDKRTLEVAARLVGDGASPYRVATAVYGEQPLGRLRLLGMVLASTELALDGRMAVSTLTRAMKKEAGSDGEDIEGLAAYGRMISGVEVAVLIREEGDGVRVSLRSRGEVDVNEIAVRLGGGGHKAAAGVVLKSGLGEARERLVSAVAESLGEPGH